MKRRLLTILLFLLAGAVVNVAVAWGCAVTVNTWWVKPEDGIDYGEQQLWWVSKEDAFGSTTYRSMRAIYDEKWLPTKGPHPGELSPGWAPFADDLLGSARSKNWTIDSRGWPMRSMWSQLDSSILREGEREIERIEGGIEGGIETPLPPWTVFTISIPRVLPLRPIWPGFAVNTLFYAAVLWLPFRGPFALRRQIRRRRGRCLKCGYDLRGDFEAGCPECGWGREEGAPASERSESAVRS